jgi:hypothetical protein
MKISGYYITVIARKILIASNLFRISISGHIRPVRRFVLTVAS